ncbi:hypothetical protein AeNC1_002092 [Aphanomyces euteiches]|nr:hypothetical protein AeNC1_002092 [Aphanomyces euteiches]
MPLLVRGRRRSNAPRPHRSSHEKTFLSVFSSRDLAAVVFSFQHGLYQDMMSFMHLPRSTDCEFSKLLMASVNAVLAPWLDTHGTSRLSTLFDVLPDVGRLVVMHAVITGRMDVLAYVDRWYSLKAFDIDLLDLAAWSNQLDVLKFLHSIEHSGCSRFAMDTASAHGYLAIVEFLHANRTEGCSNDAMDRAAENGHLNVVQFLHTHRPEGCSTNAMEMAAWRGHVDIVRYLHENRNEGCTSMAMQKAAASGHVAVIDFLHHNRREGCLRRALEVPSKSSVRRYLLETLKNHGCHCSKCEGRRHYHFLDVLSSMVWVVLSGRL